jgi:hypothetical protein
MNSAEYPIGGYSPTPLASHQGDPPHDNHHHTGHTLADCLNASLRDAKPHADYPHEPGRLDSCAACVSGPCMCDESTAPCVSTDCYQQDESWPEIGCDEAEPRLRLPRQPIIGRKMNPSDVVVGASLDYGWWSL